MIEKNKFAELNESELMSVDGGGAAAVFAAIGKGAIAVGLTAGTAVVVCAAVVGLAAGTKYVYDKLTD